jgi:hypothetical protein
MLKMNVTRKEIKVVLKAVAAGRQSANNAYKELMLFTQTVRK